MKTILLGTLLSFSAIAGVTPQQMQAIKAETRVMMFDVGADVRLKPRVTSVRVESRLGDRVKVKFSFVEELFGEKNCSYYFSLRTSKAVPRTALCGL